jgi:hypothetical protein
MTDVQFLGHRACSLKSCTIIIVKWDSGVLQQNSWSLGIVLRLRTKLQVPALSVRSCGRVASLMYEYRYYEMGLGSASAECLISLNYFET